MDDELMQEEQEDSLFGPAKQLYPDASDDVVRQKIATIRQQLPDASDDEIIGEAQKHKVNSYITNKYNIGGMGGSEPAMPEPEQGGGGFNWAAGLAGLGSAIAGRGGQGATDVLAMQAAQKKNSFDKSQALRKNTQEDEKLGLARDKMAREKDPNSQESMIARDLAKQMDPNGDYASLTAEQFKAFSPVLEKKYAITEQGLNRKESRDERRMLFGLRQDENRMKRDEKRDEKQLAVNEKKKAALTEIEDRRRNIEDNLSLVEQQIRDKGTYEAFGSHNNDLDRRIDMIATDMAKLADPNSVARPSEVENFKKGLIQSNMASMKNSTALDVLNNFRKEVGQRAENAYKIRGVENPGSQAQRTQEAPVSAGQPKMIRVKAPDGSIRLIPADKLDAAKKAGGVMLNG